MLEPPAYSVALDDPEIRRIVDAFDAWWATSPDAEAEFLQGWSQHFGLSLRVPDRLPPAMGHAVRLLRECRRPWCAELPVRSLARSAVPMLIISGAHSSALDYLSATLAAQLGAPHLRLAGAGHAIPTLGGPLNAVLEEFWTTGRAG